MDVHWRNLNTQERDVIRGLSADLSSIGNPSLMSRPEVASGQVPGEFKDAVQRGEWNRVLAILRDNEAVFPASHLAFIRGVSWAHLRQADVAARFFEEMAKIQALKPDEEIWLLTCMMQAGRTADVFSRADQIARTESSPLLLLKAAEVFSVRASELGGDDANALRRMAIDSALRGLQSAGATVDDELLAVLIVGAKLRLAFDYEALGQVGEALKYCDEVLRMDPRNATAMMLRAGLNFDRNPEAAEGEFRRGLSSGLTPTFDDLPLMPLTSVASAP